MRVILLFVLIVVSGFTNVMAESSLPITGEKFIDSMLEEQLANYNDFPVRMKTLEAGFDPSRDNAGDLKKYGNTCLFRGEWSCARHHFSKALYFNQADISSWRGLMTAIAAYGDVHDLILQARKAVQTMPDQPIGWAFLGYAYEKAGRFKDAQAAYDRAGGSYGLQDLSQIWEGSSFTSSDDLSSPYEPSDYDYFSDSWDEEYLLDMMEMSYEELISDPVVSEEIITGFEKVFSNYPSDLKEKALNGLILYLNGNTQEADEIFRQISQDPRVLEMLFSKLIGTGDFFDSDTLSMVSEVNNLY